MDICHGVVSCSGNFFVKPCLMPQLDADLLKTTNLSAHRYATKLGAFGDVRRKLIIRMAWMMPIALFMAYSLVYYRNGFDVGWSGLISLLAPVVIVAYTSVNAIKKQRIQFESFMLEIEEDAIVRRQKSLPDMRIMKKDIQSIKKNAAGMIIIKGTGFQDVLSIPAQMEAHEQMEADLAAISPIGVSTSSPWKQSLGIVSILAFLGVAYAAFTSTHKMIIAVSGILFFGIFAACIILAAINKHLSRRVRFGLLIAIIPLFSFSSAIYNRWKSAPSHSSAETTPSEHNPNP